MGPRSNVADHDHLLLVTNPQNTYKCINIPCARDCCRSASFAEFQVIELPQGNYRKICR
jgi:hypothetical protein